MVLKKFPYLTLLMREKKASSKTPKLKGAISDHSDVVITS